MDNVVSIKQDIKMKSVDLDLYYQDFQALHGINMEIKANHVTALIGPSGCGKSTFLRTLNRLNELIEGTTIKGQVYLDNISIYEKDVDVVALRKRVGMVFQKPSVFPMSVYENVAYGPRIHGVKNRSQLDEIVEKSLRDANLWDEMGSRLNSPAARMSGGSSSGWSLPGFWQWTRR